MENTKPTEEQNTPEQTPEVPELRIVLMSHKTQKKFKDRLPMTAVVDSMLTYMAVCLSRGEGATISAFDDKGRVINTIIEKRDIDTKHNPMLREFMKMDLIDIITQVANDEKLQRENQQQQQNIRQEKKIWTPEEENKDRKIILPREN